MNQKDINKMIRTAVEHSVPDVLDSILSDCEEQKGNVIQMNNKETNGNKTIKTGWIKTLGLVAAALVFIIVGLGGRNIYRARSVESIISLDINPSIIMEVNKKEKVLQVKPLNEEAEIVVGGMDLKNTNLETAVNALIGSMLKNGYIDEIANSILISVQNKDKEKGAELQAKLVEEIDSLLSASSINGAFLSQSVIDDNSTKILADANNISQGKAQLIEKLVDLDPRYKFEELAKLSINELNLLVDSKKLELENVSTVGKASDKAFIGTENALKVALDHASVESSAVKDIEVELDYDDGKWIYEVEFDLNGRDYEYDIDARTGQIILYEIDGDDIAHNDTSNDSNKKQTQDKDKDKSAVEKTDKNTNKNQNVKKEESTKSKTTYIGVDKALEKALNHAGVKKSDIRNLETELDKDDGRWIYEIEFDVNQWEYDYDIDAFTGKVLSYEKDEDDDYKASNKSQTTSQTSTKTYIGEEKALEVALNHAGVKKSEIKNLEIELDEDDGKWIYEVEFDVNQWEYDYEIDAFTGKILSFEKDD